jgi:hypothetical protein
MKKKSKINILLVSEIPVLDRHLKNKYALSSLAIGLYEIMPKVTNYVPAQSMVQVLELNSSSII